MKAGYRDSQYACHYSVSRCQSTAQFKYVNIQVAPSATNCDLPSLYLSSHQARFISLSRHCENFISSSFCGHYVTILYTMVSAYAGFVFYAYTPSKAGAAIMCILFLATALVQIWMMIRQKTWYFIPFVIGCLCTCILLCLLSLLFYFFPVYYFVGRASLILNDIQSKELVTSAVSCHRHKLPIIRKCLISSNQCSSCSVQHSSRRQSTWFSGGSSDSSEASSTR